MQRRQLPGVNRTELPSSIANLLFDYTDDNGTLWDPSLSAYWYKYNTSITEGFQPYDKATPYNFLRFRGHWGDQQYPDGDKRQSSFDPNMLGFSAPVQYKFVDGPTGPLDKELERGSVCPSKVQECVVRESLARRGWLGLAGE
jgi:hypothetical protein